MIDDNSILLIQGSSDNLKSLARIHELAII